MQRFITLPNGDESIAELHEIEGTAVIVVPEAFYRKMAGGKFADPSVPLEGELPPVLHGGMPVVPANS